MTKNLSSDSVKGVLLLLLSALFYSIMPVLIRALGSEGIPAISQVFLRYIFAFIASVVYFFLLSKSKIKIQKKDIILLLLTTIFGYALMNLFFTYGILYTQIRNALFLFYSYAIMAPILGFIFLREKVNLINIFALIISSIALFLLFQPNSIPSWKIGGFFAILSAFGQASYLILRKKLQRYPADFMMFANTLVGVIVLGILSLIIENSFYIKGAITHISPKTWITTVLFGLDNFLAWFTMTKGFEYFRATAGSLILLSELIFAIIFAFIFFKEIPTIPILTGGVLILSASTLVILKGES